jgi:hypothetical protein
MRRSDGKRAQRSTNMTTSPAVIQQRARDRAKELFSGSASFRALNLAEQQQLYSETVRRFAEDIAQGRGNGGVPVAMGERGASRQIDEERHRSERFGELGETAAEFVQAVNFPNFVRDLLKGVFDANLEVTLRQMESYTDLLKAATASLSKFVRDVDDTAAFGYLADNQSDQFGIDFFDDDKSDTNPTGIALVDKEGNKLDLGANEVKAKIMDAKIAMAREQRALLREMILMGVTRLVVERGNVKASVIFDFKAKEKIEKTDKAAQKREVAKTVSRASSGGLWGWVAGGTTGGDTRTSQESQISVSSAKSVQEASLEAKLTGSVDITFRSDFFAMDNFAAMYGPVTREAIPAAATPGAARPPAGGPVAGTPAVPAPARP